MGKDTKYEWATIIGLAFACVILVAALSLMNGTLFWLLWTLAGIGQRYFSFLPSEWHVIGFLDSCLLMWTFGIVGSAFRASSSAAKAAKE